jgi:hypothetical protein
VNECKLNGEPLWLGGKVVKNAKINYIERTRARSPPSLKNECKLKAKIKIKF